MTGTLKITINGTKPRTVIQRPVALPKNMGAVVAVKIDILDVPKLYTMKAKLTAPGTRGPNVAKGAFVLAEFAGDGEG